MDHPFKPSPHDGWLDSEPREQRLSKAVAYFLPKDFVSNLIETKDRELAMYQSALSVDDLYGELSNDYLHTTGDLRANT